MTEQRISFESGDDDDDRCYMYPTLKRINSGITTSNYNRLENHIQNSHNSRTSIRQSLRRFRRANNFPHPSMGACTEFLRVMGHHINQSLVDNLNILTSQLQVSLSQVHPSETSKLFASAREAAVFLEVPRLRLAAVALLQTFCRNHIPVDPIDNDEYCDNCGGNCTNKETVEMNQFKKKSETQDGTNLASPTFQATVPNTSSSRYDNLPSAVEPVTVPQLSQSRLTVCDIRDKQLLDPDKRHLFVSSVISNAIIEESFISSPVSSVRVSESYDRFDLSRFNDALPNYDAGYQLRQPSLDDIDTVGKQSDLGSDLNQHQPQDDDAHTFDTPKSLMRMVICRCRQNEDLYQYCRRESPLSFRKYLWPFTTDWLLDDIIHIIEICALRLRVVTVPSNSETLMTIPTTSPSHLSVSNSDMSGPYQPQHSRSRLPSFSNTPNHPLSHTSTDPDCTGSLSTCLPDITELAALVFSTPLAYRLITAVLEQLLILSATPFSSSDLGSSFSPYSSFDPESYPPSEYHNLLLRSLFESGAIDVSSLRRNSGNLELNDPVDVPNFDQQTGDGLSKLSRRSKLVPTPDYHLASIRVYLLLHLGKTHPSLPKSLDPVGWSLIVLMEELLLAVAQKWSTLSIYSSHLSFLRSDHSPVATVDQVMAEIRSFTIHSLNELLTVSFILTHPPYLLLLSELFIESQIFQSETDWIASSSQKSTDAFRALMFLGLMYPLIHANAVRLRKLSLAMQETVQEAAPEPEKQSVKTSPKHRRKRSREFTVETGEAKIDSQGKREEGCETRASKRQRKSLTAALEFVDEACGLLPPRLKYTAKSKPAESDTKDHVPTSVSVTIASIISLMRVNGNLPPHQPHNQPSNQPHSQPSNQPSNQPQPSSLLSSSLLREIRECLPRFRPVTLRFIKCLNRALGFSTINTQAPSSHSVPLSSTVVNIPEVQQRALLFSRMENFFKSVACGSLGATRKPSTTSDVEVSIAEVKSDSNLQHPLPDPVPHSLDLSLTESLPSAPATGDATTSVNIDIRSRALSRAPDLDQRFLKLTLCGLLRCGLILRGQIDLVDFVFRVSPFLDGQGLLLQDAARLFGDSRLSTCTVPNAHQYIRQIIRRIALPPSEQQLFRELSDFWRSVQHILPDATEPVESKSSTSESSHLPVNLFSLNFLLIKRILRLCHVKCLMKKASQIGLTVVDSHDLDYFTLAQQFIEAKIYQLRFSAPPTKSQAVERHLQFWEEVLKELKTAAVHQSNTRQEQSRKNRIGKNEI